MPVACCMRVLFCCVLYSVFTCPCLVFNMETIRKACFFSLFLFSFSLSLSRDPVNVTGSARQDGARQKRVWKKDLSNTDCLSAVITTPLYILPNALALSYASTPSHCKCLLRDRCNDIIMAGSVANPSQPETWTGQAQVNHQLRHKNTGREEEEEGKRWGPISKLSVTGLYRSDVLLHLAMQPTPTFSSGTLSPA